METSLCKTRDCTSIIHAVEDAHRPCVIEDDGAVIVCHSQSGSMLHQIDRNNIFIAVNII